MPAYKFLGIKTDGCYQSAEALIHGTNNKTTSFNHRLFDGMEIGTNFAFDNSKSYPDNPVFIITEEQIPGILKEDESNQKTAKEAYEKRKAENIASGKFIYWYSDFRGGKAENIRKTLSDNYDEFWQVIYETIKNDKYTSGGLKDNFSVADLKQHEHFAKIMKQAQPGDRLEWYSWNGGFLAYSAGFQISRAGEPIYYSAMVVS